MEVARRRALDGLDRLLALRPEDLDGWEADAADALDDGDRAGIEADDRVLSDLITIWSALEEPVPTLTAADLIGLPQEPVLIRRARSPARHRRTRGPQRRGWMSMAALAACVAVLGFGVWQINHLVPAPEVRFKSVVPAPSTDLDLQFSVETGASVTAGRAGAIYGPADRLAMRVQVTGTGGWLYLFEAAAGQEPVRVDAQYVASPGMVAVGGGRLWQPDTLTGETTYLAVMTSEEVEAANVLIAGILGAAERPDQWPRPVLAADWFTVHWE
jgi:hypothetical protein